MAANLGFSAGPYTWTASLSSTAIVGTSLGVVAEPPVIEISHQGEEVTADFMGGLKIDEMYLGSQVTLEMVFQEFDRPAMTAILESFGLFGGVGFNKSATPDIASIGLPISEQLSGVIHGKAVSINNTNPNHIICRRAAISTDTPLSTIYGSRLRNVPIRFTLFPYQYNATLPADPRDGDYFFFEVYTDAAVPIDADIYPRAKAKSMREALNTVA